MALAGFTVNSFTHSSKGTPKDISAVAIENTLASGMGMEREIRSVLMVSGSSPASIVACIWGKPMCMARPRAMSRITPRLRASKISGMSFAPGNACEPSMPFLRGVR